jgi:hypothetical protein
MVGSLTGVTRQDRGAERRQYWVTNMTEIHYVSMRYVFMKTAIYLCS